MRHEAGMGQLGSALTLALHLLQHHLGLAACPELFLLNTVDTDALVAR